MVIKLYGIEMIIQCSQLLLAPGVEHKYFTCRLNELMHMTNRFRNVTHFCVIKTEKTNLETHTHTTRHAQIIHLHFAKTNVSLGCGASAEIRSEEFRIIL